MKFRLILVLLMLGAFLTGMVGVAVIQRASAKQLAKNQKIIVTRPQANEVIHSPVTVAGKARGAWFLKQLSPSSCWTATAKKLLTGSRRMPRSKIG